MTMHERLGLTLEQYGHWLQSGEMPEGYIPPKDCLVYLSPEGRIVRIVILDPDKAINANGPLPRERKRA